MTELQMLKFVNYFTLTPIKVQIVKDKRSTLDYDAITHITFKNNNTDIEHAKILITKKAAENRSNASVEALLLHEIGHVENYDDRIVTGEVLAHNWAIRNAPNILLKRDLIHWAVDIWPTFKISTYTRASKIIRASLNQIYLISQIQNV